jgi:multimeric flavodoxin WrbA
MLNTLILNGSLKHGSENSNTQEVADMVIAEMAKLSELQTETIRLADKNLSVGLEYKISDEDEWPQIVDKIIAADVIIFATPIWWGQRSSLIQRLIERMDAFDEGEVPGGRGALLNKVAGIVITGSEDGAQHVLASIMEVLTFMNFTLPPQCCTYWVGEVGIDPSTDSERRRKNLAVLHMAENTARGLVHYAKLAKSNPLPKKI